MLKALVVDDMKSNRQLLAKLVSNRGVEVDVAEDGQIAVDYIMDHGHTIDIIFMDNVMPNKTGVESTDECRNEIIGYGGLIIGVTGNTLPEDMQAFLDAGADFILGKPVSVPQLDAIINHVKNHGKYSPKSRVHQSRFDDELKLKIEDLEREVKNLRK